MSTDTRTNKYLSGWDAAVDYCALSRQTLHRAEKDGRLKPIRVGTRVLFTTEMLDAFIQSHSD